jgi:hypothetical protein
MLDTNIRLKKDTKFLIIGLGKDLPLDSLNEKLKRTSIVHKAEPRLKPDKT